MSQQNKYRDADKNLYSLPVSLKIKSVGEVELGVTGTEPVTLIDLDVGEICVSKQEVSTEGQMFSISFKTPGVYGVFCIPSSMTPLQVNADLSTLLYFMQGSANSFWLTEVLDESPLKVTLPFKNLSLGTDDNYVSMADHFYFLIIRFS